MNNKEITAVEWFMEKIGEKQSNGFYVIDTLQDVQNVFQQAKEMEKEQIIDAYDAGLFDGSMDDVNDRIYKQYYNETYKSE
jgi:hypothetical protein